MSDLVSVVIPVYNVQEYIEKCINSLINQTYSNIELILVDDGSIDNSGNICDNWSNKDSRIKVIHKENGGLSSARNEGLKYVNGQYVMFVDSDDYISTNAIKEMISVIQSKNADIVISNRIHFYDDGTEIVKYKQLNDIFIMNSEQAIKEMNYNRCFDMSAHCKLYKSSLFKNIKFPIGKLSEDMFVMYKIFDKADIIIYFPKPLYYYYQRSGSISKTPKLNYDYVQAFKEQMEYIRERYPSLINLTNATYALSHMTIYNAVIVNGGRIEKEKLNSFRKIVREKLKEIFSEKRIEKKRKIQALLFVGCIPAYNILIKIYKRNIE